MEKGVMTYLASRLPDRRARRCRRTEARNATVGSDDKATSSTAVEANRSLKERAAEDEALLQDGTAG
jgi:hypothetical protein